MGQMMAQLPLHNRLGGTRQKNMAFFHGGVQICGKTFWKLHGIGLFNTNTNSEKINDNYCYTLGRDRFMAVKASYLASGLTTRTHGNTKTLPHNSLSFEVVKNVVLFINSYAEQHAILLPGRIPGYKRDNLQLLPSSTTKKVMKHNQAVLSK